MPLEREAKLAVPDGFVLPDLHGLVAGELVERGTHVLDATYWDTDSLALFHAEHGLRFRTRDGRDGTWTLKGPSTRRGPAVEREEAEVVAGADRVPDALLERVQPLAGRAELHPVARLRTRRRVIDLLREGSRLAELVEDDVVVLAGSGSEVARFHELEIEVLGGLSEAELDALVRALQASGAVLDSTAKYARALDALGLAAARQPLD